MREVYNYFDKWEGWRNELASNLQGVYRRLDIEIREEHSCGFPSHSAAKKKDDKSIEGDLLIEDILDIRFNNEIRPNLLSVESFEARLMSEDHRSQCRQHQPPSPHFLHDNISLSLLYNVNFLKFYFFY